MVTFEGKIVGNNTYCKSRVLFISKSKQSLQRYNNWEIHGTVLTYCLHAPFTFWVSMPSILTWRYPPGNYHIPPVEQENSSSQRPWKQGTCLVHKANLGGKQWMSHYLVVDYPIASRGFFPNPPPPSPRKTMASRHRLFRRGGGGVCGVLTLTSADLGREKV